MQLLPASEPRPECNDRVVIAHISDLHFTASTDRGDRIWNALLDDLKRTAVKVDVVAVTGDVIDSSVGDNFGEDGVLTALRSVKRYLINELCSAVQVDPQRAMLVVPGNHDFRVKGLFWKQSQFDLFYKEFGAYFGPRLYQELGLCLFSFDSNTPDRTLNFATGLVKENDLIEHHGQVSQVAKDHGEFWLSSTRVVLIHHHPMPIAPTQYREKMSAGEQARMRSCDSGTPSRLMANTWVQSARDASVAWLSNMPLDVTVVRIPFALVIPSRKMLARAARHHASNSYEWYPDSPNQSAPSRRAGWARM